MADDCAHTSGAQIDAISTDGSCLIRRVTEFQCERPLDIDPAEHAGVLNVLLFWLDGEVVGAGKIPIMRDMTDGMDDFEGYIQLAGAANRQLLTADNDHLMSLPMAQSMVHEIDARDGSQVPRSKLLL